MVKAQSTEDDAVDLFSNPLPLDLNGMQMNYIHGLKSLYRVGKHGIGADFQKICHKLELMAFAIAWFAMVSRTEPNGLGCLLIIFGY